LKRPVVEQAIAAMATRSAKIGRGLLARA